MSGVVTPSAILNAFLSGLPHTIRDNIYAQIHIIIEEDIPLDVDSGEWTKAFLTEHDHKSSQSFWRTVRVTGALDYILAVPKPDDYPNIQESDNPRFRQFALRAPLDARHWQAAVVQWDHLRQSDLSGATLHIYEAVLSGSLETG